ncbi:transposase [Falsigemmobacter faecalis]|uniref:Transposase n=1 Tax=Falsigemmobacter faecalis TaxID=2488730 RepID=A0A3P3DDI0_9RHOB|nr:transposase [Falsigemmobacter faecalis]
MSPERLTGASLLQILYALRSEWQLMEQMTDNLLLCGFVGLRVEERVWGPAVCSKHRDRLLNTDMFRRIMAAILAHREVKPLLSDKPFSVDGTLVKAWASMKSFRRKEERTPGAMLQAYLQALKPPPSRQSRPRIPKPARCPPDTSRAAMRQSISAQRRAATQLMPRQRIRRHGFTGSRGVPVHMLCYTGHALMENRAGLIVQGDLTQADGQAEHSVA